MPYCATNYRAIEIWSHNQLRVINSGFVLMPAVEVNQFPISLYNALILLINIYLKWFASKAYCWNWTIEWLMCPWISNHDFDTVCHIAICFLVFVWVCEMNQNVCCVIRAAKIIIFSFVCELISALDNLINVTLRDSKWMHVTLIYCAHINRNVFMPAEF